MIENQNFDISSFDNVSAETVHMAISPPFSRGSEWRKWDLHVHTPGTAKADRYDCSWEDFITELENLSDIAVFGITDYWSIDNWKKLCNEQINNHRLEGKLLIPNAELRITPVTSSEIPINLHVLFDPRLSYEEIQRQFFRQLQFESCGRKFSATRSDLIDLGRLITGNIHLEEAAAWRKGIEQFHVHYTEIKKIVELPFWRGKCIVAVDNGSNDGASGIQESAMREARCEIYRMSHVIFSPNPRDRNYFLGQGCDSAERVIQQCGSLKPCVTGSDAHDLSRLQKWHTGKVTWIKADSTFDGLKQILFEPEERVKIQDEQPEFKVQYHVINSIEISEPGFWRQKIPLNSNLVAIIGGRASGKSTLLNCIAEQIGYFQKDRDQEYDSEERQYVKNHQKSLTVEWADNSGQQDHHVDFFRQNYMINLQSKRKEVNSLIERVLKETEKASLLEQYSQFLQEAKTDIITKCNVFFSLRNRIDTLDSEIKEKGGVEGHEKAIEFLKLQLEEQKKQHSGLSDEEQYQFDQLKRGIEASETQLVSLRRDKNALDALLASEKAWQVPPLDISSFSPNLGKSLSEKHDSIWQQAHSDWLGYLHSVGDGIQMQDATVTKQLEQFKQPDIYQKGLSDSLPSHRARNCPGNVQIAQ